MLRIFICPKCFNYRMVSRKTNAVCFHCGVELIESEITYSQYTSMTLEERDIYKEKLKRRMINYKQKINKYKVDEITILDKQG